MKPNSSKIAHFPIQNYYNLYFTTTSINHFFPTVPHTYFSTKCRTKFNFIETFTTDKPETCATIKQNSTNHVPTLPTGNIGYIEVPFTNEKPKYYQVHDINSLVHNNVAHTYHPELTEPFVPTNYVSQYNDDTSNLSQFSFHQSYSTDSSPPSSTAKALYNVQPTSYNTKPRIFPPLPYCKENPPFINKFNFQFSDLTYTEYKTLCNFIVSLKNCYATHKTDVGKNFYSIPYSLKPNAQLMTQRLSKVPIYNRDKLNTLPKELEKHNNIKQIDSPQHDKPNHGTTYLNPLNFISKGDSIKCV